MSGAVLSPGAFSAAQGVNRGDCVHRHPLWSGATMDPCRSLRCWYVVTLQQRRGFPPPARVCPSRSQLRTRSAQSVRRIPTVQKIGGEVGTVVQYRAVRDDIDVRELLLRWTSIDWLHSGSPEAAGNGGPGRGGARLSLHTLWGGVSLVESLPPPLCRFRTVRVPQVADSGGSSRLWGSAETAAVQTRLGHPIVVLPPVGLPLAARVVACELL